jgi:hypothetical protein
MLKKGFILGLINVVILGIFSLALAGDTYTFKVSCVIPAIPGVNAPLEENTEYISQNPQNIENKGNASAEETFTAENKENNFVLKTIYPK